MSYILGKKIKRILLYSKEVKTMFRNNEKLYDINFLNHFYEVSSAGVVSLTSKFKNALDTNLSFMYAGEILWEKGTVLPDPYNLGGTIYNRLFYDCNASTLNLSNWNTSNVTDMEYMFSLCNNLSTLNLTNWDTSSVTDMKTMFSNCSSLTTLDLRSFDTTNVNNMGYMFNGCNNLTSIDLSSFNTNNVTTMQNMFNLCGSLTTLDLTSFETTNLTNTNNMFKGCESVTNAYAKTQTEVDLFNSSLGKPDNVNFSFDPTKDISNFYYISNDILQLNSEFKAALNENTDYIKNGIIMHKFGSQLPDPSSLGAKKYGFMNLDTWELQSVFNQMTVTDLDLSLWNTTEVVDMTLLVSECVNLSNINLSNWNTSNVTNMSGMLGNITVPTLDLSSFDTSNVTNMRFMFQNITVPTLDLSNFNTSNVTNMRFMFSGINVPELDLSNFNTSNVTDMSGMFTFSENITLDLSSFNTSNVIDTSDMFRYCNNLTTVYARTEEDAEKFRNSTGFPTTAQVIVK